MLQFTTPSAIIIDIGSESPTQSSCIHWIQNNPECCNLQHQVPLSLISVVRVLHNRHVYIGYRIIRNAAIYNTNSAIIIDIGGESPTQSSYIHWIQNNPECCNKRQQRH